MSDLIKGAQPPTSDGPPVYEVRVPKPGEVWELTLQGEYALGVFVHWGLCKDTGKKWCHPCLRDEGDCRDCKAGKPLWLGFVGAYDHTRRGRFVLRMGKESWDNLVRAIAPGTKLLGRRLSCERRGKAPTGPLTFAASQHPADARLASIMQVKPTVCMVLGVDDLADYTYGASEGAGVPS